jgi:acetoin utilization protein AcuC
MRMGKDNPVCVYYGEGLARYGFGEGHPFGPDRLEAFGRVLRERGLDRRVRIREPVQAPEGALRLFHTSAYVERLRELSEVGEGLLDYGDTPAFPGVYEASAMVAGSVLDGIERLMVGDCRRVFVPIGGLHHARRDRAAGFCAVNDCGIAVEALKSVYGLERIAYVDIDAHHGDGVFYAFEADPTLWFADLHEDGRYLYPGTGSMVETGKGQAQGRKLNVPMPPRAGDETFVEIWSKVERFVDRSEPQFILLQAGADSLAGDPIADLAYTSAAHGHAARRLCALADRHCDGRILAVGGGGYDRTNLAEAWCAVVEAFLEA